LQAERLNGLRLEIVDKVGSPHYSLDGRQQRSSRNGEAVENHRALRRRHVSTDLEGTCEAQSDSLTAEAHKPIDGEVHQLTLWDSDQPIVVRKQSNACGAKGLTAERRDLRDTSARPRAGVQMRTKLESLTQQARKNPQQKFTSVAHFLDEEFLTECFLELKRDRASGIDGVSIEDYEVDLDERIQELVKKLKLKKYKPQPVKRVYIPKSNGDKRGLGIATVEDKIVQCGVKRIVEAIFEPEFVDTSFGFRPNRGCHDAIKRLDEEIMKRPINYIVDIDIRKFFDTVDHKWLMKALEQKVKDRSLLQLIKRMLKAGVIEEGKLIEVDEGTPQGSIVSPVFTNIYLHYVLDRWFIREVKTKARGYCELIRYADDFVVCFQNERDAKEFVEALKERLKKYGLEIAEEKSKLIEFGRYAWQKAQVEGRRVKTFDFLGFTFCCDSGRNGKFKLVMKTSSKKMRQKLKEMNEWLKKFRNRESLMKNYWNKLRQKLRGHYAYYGISGNIRMLQKFYDRTVSLAFKWINRRSQKKSYKWEKFKRFLDYNPLPQPRICHSLYTPCLF
jgi:RNA-directed DNA polymerase